MERTVQFSKNLHRRLAEKLFEDPTPVITLGLQNITSTKSQVRGLATQWVEDWESSLQLEDIPHLIFMCLCESNQGDDWRSVSPFAGALSEEERQAALQEASEQWQAWKEKEELATP